MKRWKALLLMVFVLAVAFAPAAAFAQLEAPAKAPGTVTIAVPQLGDMWSSLLQFLVAVFGSVLAWLVTSFVGLLRDQKVAQVSSANEQRALEWAKLAVLRAEEWGNAAIRAGKTVTGEEKMHKAVEWLLINCPLKLTPEKAHAYAEVAVPIIGRGATAALDWARAHVAPLPPKDDAPVAPVPLDPQSGGK